MSVDAKHGPEFIEALRKAVTLMSIRAAARLLGVSSGAVAGLCHRHSISPSYVKTPRPVKEKAERKPRVRVMKRMFYERPRPVTDIPEPEPLRLTMRDLSDLQCRFVCGRDEEAYLPTYCANLTPRGKAWCPYHQAIVYRPAERIWK